MDAPELKIRRLAIAALVAVIVIVLAIGIAFALLRAGSLPAGGEGGSAALISTIPAPRLQTAPQLDRAEGASAAPPPEFEQRLGARVPRRLGLVDAGGQRIDWRELAKEGRPVVLLPAFYRCDTLCGTVAHGALEALADTGLPPGAWHLLLFSIDPHDTRRDARALGDVYRAYARFARPAVYRAAPDLRLLTGSAADSAALARSVGFRALAEPAAADGQVAYAHATGLVVLTPDGTVSRYLFGVRFDPRTLRAAIVDASQARVGTLSERLLLACSHLDPTLGLRDGLVLGVLRGVGLLVLAALVLWVWRHRGDAAPPRRPQ
ncbi:MAG TPA: SCO family protein [Burkholderiaceae bacterium]|jgi:protein SCO1/2